MSRPKLKTIPTHAGINHGGDGADGLPRPVRHPQRVGHRRGLLLPLHRAERQGRRRGPDHLRRLQGGLLLAPAEHSRGLLFGVDVLTVLSYK